MIGNTEGSAETAVTAGEVVVLPVPVRFGTLALRREGFEVQHWQLVLARYLQLLYI